MGAALVAIWEHEHSLDLSPLATSTLAGRIDDAIGKAVADLETRRYQAAALSSRAAAERDQALYERDVAVSNMRALQKELARALETANALLAEESHGVVP